MADKPTKPRYYVRHWTPRFKGPYKSTSAPECYGKFWCSLKEAVNLGLQYKAFRKYEVDENGGWGRDLYIGQAIPFDERKANTSFFIQREEEEEGQDITQSINPSCSNIPHTVSSTRITTSSDRSAKASIYHVYRDCYQIITDTQGDPMGTSLQNTWWTYEEAKLAARQNLIKEFGKDAFVNNNEVEKGSNGLLEIEAISKDRRTYTIYIEEGKIPPPPNNHPFLTSKSINQPNSSRMNTPNLGSKASLPVPPTSSIDLKTTQAQGGYILIQKPLLWSYDSYRSVNETVYPSLYRANIAAGYLFYLWDEDADDENSYAENESSNSLPFMGILLTSEGDRNFRKIIRVIEVDSKETFVSNRKPSYS